MHSCSRPVYVPGSGMRLSLHKLDLVDTFTGQGFFVFVSVSFISPAGSLQGLLIVAGSLQGMQRLSMSGSASTQSLPHQHDSCGKQKETDERTYNPALPWLHACICTPGANLSLEASKGRTTFLEGAGVLWIHVDRQSTAFHVILLDSDCCRQTYQACQRN